MRSVNSKTEKENSEAVIAQPVITVRVPCSLLNGRGAARLKADSRSAVSLDWLPESPRQHSAGQDIINQYKQAVARPNARALVRMIRTNQRPASVKRNTVRRRDYTAYKKRCIGSTPTAFLDTGYLTDLPKPARPATGARRLGRRSALDFW